MITTTIKKGTHAPFRMVTPLISKDSLSYTIRFTNSCAYDLGTGDQMDVNKLFGFGYVNSLPIKKKTYNLLGKSVTLPWFSPFHHINSVRFGWRYDTSTSDHIEILAYYYKGGNRHIESMLFVAMDIDYRFSIRVENDRHYLTVEDDFNFSHNTQVQGVPSSPIAYLLKPYFGGNRKAPHDMTILIK